MKYEIVNAKYVNDHLDDTVIVDVRPRQMYAVSRIPGAISIPFMAWREEQEKSGVMFGELFKAHGVFEGTHVIVYCYNGGLAREACSQLHDEGYYHIHCYEGSWVDWISSAENPIDERELALGELSVEPAAS